MTSEKITLVTVPRSTFQLAIEEGIRSARRMRPLTDEAAEALRRIGRTATLVDGNFDCPTGVGCPAQQAGLQAMGSRLGFARAYDRMMPLAEAPVSDTLYKIV